MKRLIALGLALSSISALASNYPSDYCHANVRICEDGPAIFANIHSGCNSTGVYVIGYKKAGVLGSNLFVDAIVNFKYGNSQTVQLDFRVTPDWNNLGFLTSGIDLWSATGRVNSDAPTDISIAFSDGHGIWDSRGGANYHFPINDNQSATCYNVSTNDNYYSQVPYSAWNVINEAMTR